MSLRSLALVVSFACLSSVASAQSAPAAPPPAAAPSVAPEVEAPTPPAATDACFPTCRDGFLCHAGSCISACNPVCGGDERCTAQGQCISTQPAPTHASQPQPAFPAPIVEPGLDAPPPETHSVGHKVQLGLGTSLLRFTKLSVDLPDSDESQDVSTTRVGPQQGARLTLGYGLSPAVVLATDFTFQFLSRDSSGEGGAPTQSEVMLAPSIQFMIPKSSVFVGAKVSVDVTSLDSDYSSETDTLFGIHAVLGAHSFITSSVSIDPQLSFGYVAGSASIENEDEYVYFEETQLSMSGFEMAIELGLSVWL